MAKTVWSAQTLTSDSDLTKVEPAVASWGVTSLSDKHTLAKDETARRLRQRFAEYKQNIDPKAEGQDGSTAASATFTAAGGNFVVNKVGTSDRLWITSGTDKGAYTISAVAATTLTVSPTLTATASALPWYIEVEMLDFIENPLILTSSVAYLVLHFAALELVRAPDDHWDMKQRFYFAKFKDMFEMTAPDLLLDVNQDDVISQSERKFGISSGGRLLR